MTTKRNIRIRAGAKMPDYVDPFVLMSLHGKWVIHLVPVGSASTLCDRGATWYRSSSDEFDRTLCGECAAIAQRSEVTP